MTSLVHRRALLRWLALSGLSLPLLVHGPFAAEPDENTRSLEAFLKQLLRQLFPHPDLDEGVYSEVATVMTGAVEANPGLLALAEHGLHALDATAGHPWRARGDAARQASLQAVAHEPFFLALRGLGGLIFYNTAAVWPLVGYEGPSFERGGYLARGFDDIDWLPATRDAH